MIIEAWISMIYLSNTNQHSFFKTVDVLFRCGKLDPNQPSLALACSESGNTLYLLEEEAFESQDLSRYLQRREVTDKDRIKMGFLLVRALAEAADKGVVQFRPEPSDLLVRPAPEVRPIFLDRKHSVFSDYWPYFDNLSRCKAIPIEDGKYRWALIDEMDLRMIRDYISLSLQDSSTELVRFFQQWTPDQNIPDRIFDQLGGQYIDLNRTNLTTESENISRLAADLRQRLANPPK
jgi:hypothetical protein